MKDTVDTIKGTASLLPEIYKDLAQPSVQKVGKALGCVFDLITLPTEYLTRWSDFKKENINRHFEKYRQKMEEIPEEKVCEVHPQVGVPIMERLEYTTCDEISDLYINLLTKASSYDTANLAHPSFVQFIERMSVDEARIIKYLESHNRIPCIEVQAHKSNGKGYNTIISNETMIDVYVELVYKQNVHSYLDNFCSMGLLMHPSGTYIVGDGIYEPILDKLGYERLKHDLENREEYKKVDFDKTFSQLTDMGKEFIKACLSKDFGQ